MRGYSFFNKDILLTDVMQQAKCTAVFDSSEMLNYFTREYIKDQILLGRSSLGEPENLEYVMESKFNLN